MQDTIFGLHLKYQPAERPLSGRSIFTGRWAKPHCWILRTRGAVSFGLALRPHLGFVLTLCGIFWASFSCFFIPIYSQFGDDITFYITADVKYLVANIPSNVSSTLISSTFAISGTFAGCGLVDLNSVLAGWCRFRATFLTASAGVWWNPGNDSHYWITFWWFLNCLAENSPVFRNKQKFLYTILLISFDGLQSGFNSGHADYRIAPHVGFIRVFRADTNYLCCRSNEISTRLAVWLAMLSFVEPPSPPDAEMSRCGSRFK